MRHRHCCSAFIALLVGLTAPESVSGSADVARVRYRVPPAENTLCGVDSLYICMRMIGMANLTLAELEKELPARAQGHSLDDLVSCCRKRAITTTVVRTNIDSLGSCGYPLLLHVNKGHFVALVGDENGRLTMFDNAIGLFDCAVRSGFRNIILGTE